MLIRGGGGFGALALAAMLEGDSKVYGGLYEPRKPHRPAKAKSVIFLFMEGGPSHIDLFDPKPLLNELAGQKLPSSFMKVITAMGESNAPLLASKRKWKQHGESGLWISDWLPHLTKHADDLAVIRSCWGNGINHAGGVCQMNTGSPIAGRPSLGSWVTYGLGTENQSLPAFVVMQDRSSQIVNGVRMWGTGFMPAVYQGTQLNSGPRPIDNLDPPAGVGEARQRSKLSLLDAMNRRHQLNRRQQTELEARIESYELAFRMQAEAPEAVDLSRRVGRLLASTLRPERKSRRPPFGPQVVLAGPSAGRARGSLCATLSRCREPSGMLMPALRPTIPATLRRSMDLPVAGLAERPEGVAVYWMRHSLCGVVNSAGRP